MTNKRFAERESRPIQTRLKRTAKRHHEQRGRRESSGNSHQACPLGLPAEESRKAERFATFILG